MWGAYGVRENYTEIIRYVNEVITKRENTRPGNSDYLH